MPRCLWCDAPNPDHAAAMERLKAEEKAEQVSLQELREKNREILHESLERIKNEKSSISLTENFKERLIEAKPKKNYFGISA